MTISQGYRDIEIWASSVTADRTAPDDATLTPTLTVADGWPASFSADDGDTPRRAVFNWILHALTSAAVDLRNHGGLLPWTNDTDVAQYGVRQVAGVLYYATVATGPSHGNVTNPAQAGQTVWRQVVGTVGAPSAPNAPSGTAVRSRVLLWEWNCPLDGGAEIAGFDFQWREQGAAEWSATITTTAPRYEQDNLSNGTAYEARVRARNSSGSSLWSNVGTGTAAGTIPAGGSTLALRADPGDSQAELDWLEPDDGGLALTGYVVQWRTANQAFSSGREQTVSAGTTTATVTGLTNGTEYFFQVRASNSAGSGTWSNEAAATPVAATAATAVPDRAAAPTGVAGQGRATWAWAAPSDNGADITGYQFRFRKTSAGSWTQRTVSAVPTRTETGLDNGSAYEAQVRATNSAGTQSQWSPSGSVTPAAAVPDQIQHVELDNVSSGIKAVWGVPEANGDAIDDYTLQVANNSSFTAATSYTVSGTTRTITGVSDGQTRYVRVRANNGAGSGQWSPTASIRRDDGVAVPDAPDAPDTPVGTAFRPLGVRWTGSLNDSNGADFTKYQLQWRLKGNSWSGNVIETSTPLFEHTVPNGSKDVEARWRAQNSAGWSEWSSTGTVRASNLLATAVPDRAAAPTGVAGQGRATWAWAAPSDNGADITGYQFRFRKTSAGSWTQRTVSAVPTRTETGLDNGSAYEAQVRATNSAGTQSQWSPSGSVTPAAAVPDQIQHVELDNVSSGIKAVWGVPEANGDAIDDYTLQVANNSSFTAATSYTVSGTTRTITGVSDGQTRYVRVRANNGAGSGQWSPTASIRRDDGVAVPDAPDAPDTPVGTAFRPLGVRWTGSLNDSNGADFTKYQLQWRLKGNSWSGNVIETSTPLFEHKVPNGSKDVEARWRAQNSDGWSEWSSTGTVTAANLLDVISDVFSVPGTWPYADISRAVAIMRFSSESATVRRYITKNGSRLTTNTPRVSGSRQPNIYYTRQTVTGLAQGDQISTSTSGGTVAGLSKDEVLIPLPLR